MGRDYIVDSETGQVLTKETYTKITEQRSEYDEKLKRLAERVEGYDDSKDIIKLCGQGE
jgi:hypothetical protein